MPRSLLRVTTAAACAALVATGLATPSAASADRSNPSASAGPTAASGPANRSDDTQASCAALEGLRVPAKDIGLRTRGATITATNPQDSPASFCQVLGEIHPVDRSAPPIRFQVNLPRDWNRRTMLFGGGGYNGTIAAGVGQVPAGPASGPTPLQQGYVTYGSDSGHQAGPATSRDGRFLANDEALANFAGDALKKTHDVAMRLVRERYGAAPTFRYVAGGSTGGREALIAVSRWPRDFDGAIALYPAWNAVALNLQFGAMARQLARPGAYPSQAKRTALLTAATQACDTLDGLADGVISNQKACDQRFDPATARLDGVPLRCPAGKDTGPNCLSDEQIRSFRVLDGPMRLGYRLANGARGYPGFTTWGTDFGRLSDHPLQATVVNLTLGLVAPASPMPPVTATASPPYGATFWDEWVRYGVTRDAGFDSLSLDPARPGTWRQGIVELSRLQEADTRGLRAFARRGGKILVAHGVHDGLVSNRASQDYLQRVRDEVGTKRSHDLIRYYEIPGYGHAASTVFNAEWDSLRALTDWVERDRAPRAQVVTDRAGEPDGRTRPLCEFPTWPRYDSGDVNRAESFRCSRG